MPGSVIVSFARTPIGKLSGALASLTAMACLAMLFKVWKPKDRFAMADGKSIADQVAPPRHPAGEVLMAWMPYIMLVIIVLIAVVQYVEMPT